MSQLKLSGDASGTGIVTVAAPNTNNTYTVTLPAAAGTLARTDAAQTFTGTQTFSSDPVLNAGTANGVLYLNGSKAATSGSALTFDGTTLKVSQGYVISWQSVQTTGFTAVAGRGYPCNTTSAGFTVTLPASPSAGDIVSLTDYAGTWGNTGKNLTVSPNGGKINGLTSNVVYNNSRYSVQLVYVDSTQGWLVASGWSVGAFSADFLVVAGGGAGGGGQNDGYGGGGGGAGGYRTSVGTTGGGGSTESSLTIIPNVAYTVTVGAGGAGATNADGSDGNDSVFASITSTKGGGGAGSASRPGRAGGSGGGSNVSSQNGGSGTANQGYAGGKGDSSGAQGAGGGGAGGAGGDGTNPSGVGLTASSSIDPTTTARGGGGAGNGLTATSGGGNGGSSSVTPSTGVAGSVNTGGGGGGGKGGPVGGGHGTGGNGGRGVVIIKIPDTRTATFSSGVTSTLSTAVTGFKIYTVTQTSTTSETVIFN